MLCASTLGLNRANEVPICPEEDFETRSKFHIWASGRNGNCSEEDKDLSYVTLDVLNFFADNIESDGLGKRSALADSHYITNLNTERWRAVSRDGFVTLLKSVVLLDVMEIIAADDDGSLHLGWNNDTPRRNKFSIDHDWADKFIRLIINK